MLSELSYDVVVSGKSGAYTILLDETEWHTAAGTAIAYSIEVLPALDYGMDKYVKEILGVHYEQIQYIREIKLPTELR